MGTYVIGSFNIQKFNLQSNDNIRKEYVKLAEIIKNENFDVIAIQEALNNKAIKKLKEDLGLNWAYRWASPLEYSKSSKEGYAYLWRTDRLRLVKSDPVILNEYRIKGNRGIGDKGLIRPPYYARFTPKDLPGGSSFEIRLLNTHIIFGKPANIETSLSNAELRKEELRVLSEEIYRKYSTKRYGDNLPSYTILLGDYNLCLAGGSPKIDAEIRIDNYHKLKIVQDEKTSLKSLKHSDSAPDDEEDEIFEISEYEGDYYSHDYDHFAYESSYEDKLGLDVQRVDALDKYYDNDLEKYRREISDHVPIRLELDLKPHSKERHHGN